ncbi:MAG: hypothetical protein Q9219_007055 [cf. Caloplaca sp. 3 TL-2023]
MATPVSKGESHGQKCQILLYGDLSSVHFEDQLRRLLHVKTNPLLVSFFDRVSHGLRRALEHLPMEQQDFFPRFTTIVDLLAKSTETDGSPVLDFFLLSVHEMAQTVEYFTEDSVPFPPLDNTFIIGLCTGGFAAAALSCSQTISELISNGVHAVLAAFRTALWSFLVGRSLSSRTQSANLDTAWSAAVSAVGEASLDTMLDEYTSTNASIRDPMLWVSATTVGRTTTLSGRPTALQDFISTNTQRLQTRLYTAIRSPYHTALLFDDADVRRIVDQTAPKDVDQVVRQTTNVRLLSSSTGRIIPTSDFKSLLTVVVHEALREPIHWDLLLASCLSLLTEMHADDCTIRPFSSSAASMVSTELSNRSSIPINVQNDIRSAQSSAPPSSGRFEDSKIAIIGYSGRFPSADSNKAFWELLKAGRDVHREIPADRFDWKTHFDESGKRKNTSRVKYGCFIDEPGLFDTRFFSMSPREAENTDPGQRLAITATYEAMEMAGMVRNRTPSTQQDRVGVFFGTTSDDWREVNSGQDIGTYFIPGGNRAFVPGRISYFFRFSGPSLSIDTACSSSFAAIQAACSYLWRGECDTAIAGGTNVLTNPDNFAGLDRGHFLSTTGNCNAFDDEASGYCRSDAVGSVILKRLEDAQADNDPIFGVIVGTNTNHCGQTDSITRPHEGDQSSVFKRILRHSNTDPLNVSYVEMHGTGTQAGDATEMNSVLSVFVPGRKRTSIQPVRPLYLGSAKANVGHAESASGVSSLIKVLMMMKHSQIPRHCGIKTRINRNYPLDLAQRGVCIAMDTVPWRRQDTASNKRSVFLNNFSAAGGNTVILLEDAPVRYPNAGKDGRLVHMVAVTAKSSKSLIANIDSLVSFLENEASSVSLPALSYTTTARRLHYNYRAIVSGSDVSSIISALRTRRINLAALAEIKPIPTAANKQPRVVFVFPGQSMPYVEIAKSLYTTNATFHAKILQLNHLAKIQNFPPFLGLIDGSTTTADLPDVSAVEMQLALVSIQIALCDLWKSWNVMPAAVTGHSLGEYAMLYAAGVLSIADVIYLVGMRATLLEARCTPGSHSMLVIKSVRESVEQLICRSPKTAECEVACVNQPSSQVVAGPEDAILEVAAAAASKGIETLRLDVPFAFHSAQVEPILQDFEHAAAQGVSYHSPDVPVLSPLLARVVPAGSNDVFSASYLAAACRGRVDFAGALAAAATAPAQDGSAGLDAGERTIWLELGAHPVCSGMVKGTLGSHAKVIASLRQNVDGYKTLTAALEVLYLAGIDVNWNEYHRDFGAAHAVIDLPTYSWDLKNYWIQYRNDFCLTKGDGMLQQPVEPPAAVRKYLSPAAQQVVEESHGLEESSLVVESDIFDPRLLPVLQGHVVNGATLCPSSLYADIALTMSDYILLQSPHKPLSAEVGLDVGHVRIEKPLIARPDETTQRFRISATATWSSQLIAMVIYSVDGNGRRTITHARLEVHVTRQQRWLDEWKRNTHLIMARVDALDRSVHDQTDDANSHLIKRGMAYKLFGAFVEYGKEYQGMAEVVLDSNRLEAVATIEFAVDKQGFYLNPKWIDSLGHIAGFIMNANDGVDSRTQVFINHGWERMRFGEMPQMGRRYRAYNRMQLVEKTTYAGDTYILDDGRIVAIFEGVKFQGVPRSALDNLLPSKKITPAPGPIASKKHSVSKELTSATASKPAAYSSPPQPQLAVSKPAGNVVSGIFDRILGLISQEVGIEMSELRPESDFTELGMDSLLSLTIISRIRDELGLDFPQSLFIDHPTVKDLQIMVGKEEGDGSVASGSNSDGSSDDEGQGTGATSVDLHTPPLEASSSALDPAQVHLLVREVVAKETRVGIDELKPSTNLADIGVDSLLSLTISGALQEVLQISIADSLVVESETLQDIEDSLCKALGLDSSGSTKSREQSNHQLPFPRDLSTREFPLGHSLTAPAASNTLPRATSILLSGSPHTAQLILFLFPDGSGSASSYAALAPHIDPDRIAVYGLNCPWRKTGAEMVRLGINLSSMVAQYVLELRRLLSQQQQRHTKTPPQLALGGWSAGGILALEAVRQLQQPAHHLEAIKVDKLILFDSPNPIGLQNPPARMYDFFNSLGIFGGGGKSKPPPQWLQEHFNAFLSILDAYTPTPLPHAPASMIIYARDGVCKDSDGPRMETREDDPREMLWLLNNRTEFKAEGWGRILGNGSLRVEVVDEVNHFSLVDSGPKMTEVGEIVTGFLLVGGGDGG